MSNIVPITTVNASVVQAPLPSTLQQTGAIISQGGTTQPVYPAAGSLVSYPTLASGVAALSAAKPLTSLTWSGSVVTGTTTAPHGWTIGDVISAVIAGETPAGYNGTVGITITGASTFTYPLVSNPGAQSVAGTVILLDEAILLSQLTTYFAGNGVPAVNILELGEGTPSEGVILLTTFLTNNPNAADAGGPTPQSQYAYLMPNNWDNVTTFLALLNTYNAPDKMTYFYISTTVANEAVYAGKKSVFAFVQAPGVLFVTEFGAASAFGTALKQNPSSSNKVPPMSYAPAFGVTPYPLPGNQAVFIGLATNNVNWIATGAEGGLPSVTIIKQGQMSDGNPWNFWYSVDWMQINSQIAISNEVINGSATTLNPLYYDQDGIDRLQNRVTQVGNQAVSYGLALGQVISTRLPIAQFLKNFNAGQYAGQMVINAEPFDTYVVENPSDYAVGKYAGLACVYPPLRGFLNIFFNLQAVTFA